MIKAVFYRNSDNSYKGFTVSGHAGYARAGKDIVCAAVSALTINTVNCIESLTENECEIEQDKTGTIKFKFKAVSDSDGQLLVKTLATGLMELAKEYGDKHLQLYFKEV